MNAECLLAFYRQKMRALRKLKRLAESGNQYAVIVLKYVEVLL